MGLLKNISNGIKSIFIKSTNKTSIVQTRDNNNHPFTSLDNYVPLKVEYELYKTMREAVPLLDTAINKIVRLVGKFDVECEDEKEREQIKDFIDNVKVNSNQTGMDAFVESYLDQLIECGNSAAEIVLNNSKNAIYALKNVDIRSIKLKTTDNPLINLICQEQLGKIEPVVLPYQDLILFTPLDPEGDSPYGVSLFRSLPFMTSILLRIFSSIDNNWERFGNPRYSVTYKPTNDSMDKTKVVERVNMITDSFNDVMNAAKKGDVKDFVGVGDIEIKVIGADNQILESEVPVKQVLEQIVAKTGLPPFLLGLSWSTTERMSQQQADFLTSELENYRDEIEPMIKQVIDTWQLITGQNISYKVIWDDINLQDAVETAKADVFKEQARSKQIENVIKLRNENIINQQIAAEELGYDKPVGDKPTFFMPENAEEDKISIEEVKSKHSHSKNSQDCGCSFKTNQKPDDPIQEYLEQKTTTAYMTNIRKLEKKIINTTPILVLANDLNKSFKNNNRHEWDIPDEVKDLIEDAIEDFIKDMLGKKGKENNYGTYGEYLLKSFEYGLERGINTVNDMFDFDYDISVEPSYNHPYIQELLENGMELVTTKAKDKKEEILDIIVENAAVGDNPTEWARELNNKFRETLTGERWYWERLARSESAMAIDRGETAEYEENGFDYVEWIVAPDACDICLELEGQMWPIDEAPMVVEDTHPHCRCRKIPRTKRQYQEYLGNL